MKYLVKTRTTEIWYHWYEVEADSADEANKIVCTNFPHYMRNFDEKFVETDNEEILEIEPFDDN